MDLEAKRKFSRALFGKGEFPGHGVRVDVPGGPFDVNMLSKGTVEQRARMGREVLRWEVECAEAIGDDRVPAIHVNTGTDVFAAAYGSPVHRAEDAMPFAMPAVHCTEEADRLAEPDLFSGPIGELFALADRLVELCGTDYPLRISDIQSPFDIGALIWQKDLFFRALVDEPEAVHRLLAKITRIVADYVHSFCARYTDVCTVHYPLVWMPADYGICLSEDDCGSISVRHFERFALPYLQQLAAEFGGISLHCCAAGQHQWDSFAKLPNIHYLNLFHPPTDLETSIRKFSGKAVLIPGPHAWSSADPWLRGVVTPGGHAFDSYLDYVRHCLALARPDTRFFFCTEAPTLAEAHELGCEIKALCGRRN
jgi:Uroporphyrinogen decarboxylase (URO-D)